MIHIENLIFSYGDVSGRGVVDLQVDIKKGECILLCGKSGCGKTTITKLINGLIPHFVTGQKKGNVKINGENIENIPMYILSGYVSSVFQNPKSQFFNLDSASEIVFSMENQGVPVKMINRRLEQTVNELGIQDLMKKNLFHMSGGEKQIIAFACAYASDPDILVLDEPSANLDVVAMEVVRKILDKMKSLGKTIIIAEHRISYLSHMVDRVYYIDNGKIKKVYGGGDFYSISNSSRIAFGLREIKSIPLFIQKNKVLFNGEKHTLKVENLHLAYNQQTVVEHIEFELHSGEIVAIIGENGAGKTTLSRCICGLHKQKSGKIYLDGRELNQKSRLDCSYIVMQDVNHQLFGESVENECFLGNKKVEKEKVYEVLKELDLYDEKEAHPQSLSGGQKQRLAIAVAILAEKKILIFDEPTSGLDYGNMMKVSKLIGQLSKKGFLTLIITHDIEFLNATCNRCIYLQKKRATDSREGQTEIV